MLKDEEEPVRQRRRGRGRKSIPGTGNSTANSTQQEKMGQMEELKLRFGEGGHGRGDVARQDHPDGAPATTGSWATSSEPLRAGNSGSEQERGHSLPPCGQHEGSVR